MKIIGLAEKIILIAVAGGLITGSILLTNYLSKKSHQQNCERYGHLIGQPKLLQRSYILEDLGKDNWGFKYNHPLGFTEGIKRMTINGIIDNINNCE